MNKRGAHGSARPMMSTMRFFLFLFLTSVACTIACTIELRPDVTVKEVTVELDASALLGLLPLPTLVPSQPRDAGRDVSVVEPVDVIEDAGVD